MDRPVYTESERFFSQRGRCYALPMSRIEPSGFTYLLHPFPVGAHAPDVQVHVTLAGTTSGELRLAYLMTGDLTNLKIPASVSTAAADGLWQHTCFEAFIAARGDAAYHEFNFSPSGQWAMYRFDAYRTRDITWSAPAPPVVRWRSQTNRLALDAVLETGHLPPLGYVRSWDVGLAAVVESSSGRLSYWALSHPTERPDFHDRRAFLASASGVPTLTPP